MAYYVLIVYTETTTFQAFFVITLCLGIQLLSHLIFEGGIPQRLPTKEDSALFQVLDLANDFFLAQFHYMLTLMVRCDLLPILQWRSDASLHKLMTATQELKYGKKAPWKALQPCSVLERRSCNALWLAQKLDKLIYNNCYWLMELVCSLRSREDCYVPGTFLKAWPSRKQASKPWWIFTNAEPLGETIWLAPSLLASPLPKNYLTALSCLASYAG